MTQTGRELWSDNNFLIKRMYQQNLFLFHLGWRRGNGSITEQRFLESYTSAIGVLERLLDRYKELNGPCSTVIDIYQEVLNTKFNGILSTK